MGLVEKRTIIARISPPLDTLLATQVVDEFVSMEQRFIQRDWEPAELDGGQFCEVLARALYAYDSGNVNRTKSLEDCLKYIDEDKNSHVLQPRHSAIHIARVLRTVYKFRSQRGAVHITPNYTPSQMDARYVIEAVRWCMMETLRIFWGGDRERVAKAIRELLQFDVPAVGVFEDIILVQRTDLTPEEELLVLLHYAGEQGFSRAEIGRHCLATPPRITEGIQLLMSPKKRQVIRLSDGRYRLTDLGSKRIRDELAEKLLIEEGQTESA